LQYYRKDKVQRLVLLDLSSGMLDQARNKRAPEHTQFVKGDVQHIPFPDGTFDTVTDTFSFCVYENPVHAASEMARVLLPGEMPATPPALQHASQGRAVQTHPEC
jgi:ubiquinone/menaquinone biosynthesis C-methylase UbiE